MSQEIDIECPSGLIVTLREFRVSDEDLLANPKAQRQGLAVTSLLKAITVDVKNSGLYQAREDEGRTLIDWDSVLQGDRMAVLLKNRIFTWGEELTFSQPCENCRQKVTIDLDLNELPIKELPESSKAHVGNPEGSPLECVLPGCGKRISFRLLFGKDDKALQKLQKQNKEALSSAYLAFRVKSVEGITGTGNIKTFLRELGGRDASYLRAQFDAADCGVDQEVTFDCDSCDHVWNDDVKFRADFLFPKYRVKT